MVRRDGGRKWVVGKVVRCGSEVATSRRVTRGVWLG